MLEHFQKPLKTIAFAMSIFSAVILANTLTVFTYQCDVMYRKTYSFTAAPSYNPTNNLHDLFSKSQKKNILCYMPLYSCPLFVPKKENLSGFE